MFKQAFTCKVQEPLILFKKAKTEQTTEALDYIPGSVFRGAVAAKLFAEGIETSLIDDIIFNGSVQFGDAHICLGEQRALQMPFSYYQEVKKDNDKLEVFHSMGSVDWLKSMGLLPEEGDKEEGEKINPWARKLKQKRDGYFILKDGKIQSFLVETDDRIKSARSVENRASKNGLMYFYRFIEAGQTFGFEIRAKSEGLLEEIIPILKDQELYFGKSKQAEFGGSVSINIPETNKPGPHLVDKVAQVLYADSNLCFLNKWGEFTSAPTGEQLTGNPHAEIDWSKSQIRFRTYSPYNSYRQAYDFERLIIEKGSVFVLKKPVTISAETIENGVGCFLTEGFGRLILNPEFLTKPVYLHKTFEFEQATDSSENEGNAINTQDSALDFLERKYAKLQMETELYKKAGEFMKSHGLDSISASQWGAFYQAVRKVQTEAEFNITLFDENTGICTGGVNNSWRKKNAEKLLQDKKEALQKENFNEANRIDFFRIYSKRMLSEKRRQKHDEV
ncbi:hypothetical protein LAG90_09030 [Marinilongibacter aquaticus]|uniref:hypothetical protein n=1 Tax=Marinilongibacter aquaticus TaxID=2975157 RepID=UPI0021BCFEB7|nr:hypothetical protein [Marinilongibacter aquaticus]UBM60777.1 hypothetical protein LAG90_09030 [Marinilongibacter aquaticus]